MLTVVGVDQKYLKTNWTLVLRVCSVCGQNLWKEGVQEEIMTSFALTSFAVGWINEDIVAFEETSSSKAYLIGAHVVCYSRALFLLAIALISMLYYTVYY